MKKIVLAIVTLVALCGASQAQRHIEYRWHGVYVTGDMSYGMNINRTPDEFDVIGDTLSCVMPSITVGYSFRKEAALGLGFTYVADPTGAYTQLPLFVELRSHFSRNQLTPYTVLQAGYTMPLGASSVADPYASAIEEGGLYLGIEAGVRYAFSRQVAVAGHVGYRMMQSNVVHRRDAEGTSIVAPPVVLHVLAVGATLYFSN